MKSAKIRGIKGAGLSVTAGNASGIIDGSAALLITSEAATENNSLTIIARIVGMSAAGVPPRIMGIGPVPATQKVLERAGLTIDQMDALELNEASAARGLAALRAQGIRDDAST